jgi:transglutaminase-like putative cysteine protease
VEEHAELLTETPRTSIDDNLRELARETVGTAAPREAARAVSGWVLDKLEYVPGSTGVQTGAPEAWSEDGRAPGTISSTGP